MNEHKDEQWFDDQLRRAINTTRPVFDAEAWKLNHAEAYSALTARVREAPNTSGAVRRRAHWIAGGLVAAAAILVGVTVLLTQAPPQSPEESPPGVSAKAASPANSVSLISLRRAYRQGGEEAMNQQLDMALEQLGPRLNGLSALRVMRDLDG